ncbi:MAG: hypothetical protein IJF88_04625 [Oscillospiraceae bacterium]|nr:hypothetical protein [Oscillospiraceae bacterium]
MLSLGKIDLSIYRCVTPDIVTDEVILTDERISHIRERHSNVFECFSGYLREIVSEPDYIIRDDRFATAIVLKMIQDGGNKFRISLRLATSSDNPAYKNSVLTFLNIREKEWNRLLRNKEVLYKRE